MTEIFELYNGKGKIKIKGNITDSYLYFNGKAQMVSFFAEIGTVWRYLVGEPITIDIIEQNYYYEKLVSSGQIFSNNPLHIQFEHILNVLSNGKYELTLCEFPHETILIILDQENKSYDDFYGGTNNVVLTQSYLDSSIVEKYKNNIRKGERPICVLLKLKDSWSIFVLDGHHKLTAYSQLKINPQVLVISKLDNHKIDSTTAGLNILKELGLSDKKIIDCFQNEVTNKIYEKFFINCYSKGLKELGL